MYFLLHEFSKHSPSLSLGCLLHIEYFIWKGQKFTYGYDAHMKHIHYE